MGGFFNLTGFNTEFIQDAMILIILIVVLIVIGSACPRPRCDPPQTV